MSRVYCFLQFLIENDDGDCKLFKQACSFENEQILDEHNDSGFNYILEVLNHNLPKGWYTQDIIELYSISDVKLENCIDINV